MKVTFTGRHVEVTEPLKTFTQERLDKVKDYLDVMDVSVTVSVEKHRHIAELTLKARQGSFVASAETNDMYASIGQAVDKLEAQASKEHGRRADKERTSLKEVLVGENAE